MQISISTEYAIHSVLYMAVHSKHHIFMVSEIALAQNIPGSYLAKVFRNLAKTGVIRSYRGSKGGYSLGRSPEKITLRDVVEAMEGSSPMFQSLGERRGCKVGLLCLLKDTFAAAQHKLYAELEQISFEDLKQYAFEQADNMDWLMKHPPNERDMP